jgi:restriction system protein
MTVWMVRAGAEGERDEFALDNGLACIGWDEVPDLSHAESREAIADLLRRAYPDDPQACPLN